MAQDDTSIIFFAILLYIIIFSGLFCLTQRIKTREKQIFLPCIVTIALAVLGFGLYGFLNGDFLALLLIIPVPTLSLFTVLPFLRPSLSMKGKEIPIGIISVVLTAVFLYYLWGSNFSGIPNVFQPVTSHVSGALYILVEVLSVYFEMVALCGVLAGAILLISAIIAQLSDETWYLAVIVLFVLASWYANTFLPGLLAIFLVTVLRETKLKMFRILMPAFCALAFSLLITLVFLYADFFLFAIILISLGVITFDSVFYPHMKKLDHCIVVFLCSAITVGILSFLYTNAGPGILETGIQGVTIIASSGAYLPEVIPLNGITGKMMLYFSAFFISTFVYGAIAIVNQKYLKRKKLTLEDRARAGGPGIIPSPTG
jgi:hypothetical protein